MKGARRVTVRRVLVETAAALAIHAAAVAALSRVRLLEHILAPGPGSGVALVVTAAFLLLRIFVLVLVPGWFLARLWLCVTDGTRPFPPWRK